VTIERIGVVGAGTMGAGIAQIACLGGFASYLHDPVPEALGAGERRLRGDLLKGADRGRWSRADAEAASARLRATARLDDLERCELVIEAAPEDLELKRELFARLADACGPDAILATNTSSLSVTAIAAGVGAPERLCGMHFFNPPALMRLVEVVAGEHTSDATLDAAEDVARRIGREPVRCADSVGFIVNRCNRPFTLEALRILDEGRAGHAEIDRVLREDGGYRMGPFELMDLVGIDVNLAVARSFFEQRQEPRWRPHPIQERMVSEGKLGRKTDRGFYDYPRPDDEGEALDRTARSSVLDRIISQLVNEAAFAAEERVAVPDDIDTAMKLGLNHPRGPFEWARARGPQSVLATLDSLRDELGDDRYSAAPLLRRWVAAGTPDPPPAR
jgi:3-hydroxybutyryl-CoA dehydrogenase